MCVGGLPGHCALPPPPGIPPIVWGGGQVHWDAVLTHTLDCGAARTFLWHPALRAWARRSVLVLESTSCWFFALSALLWAHLKPGGLAGTPFRLGFAQRSPCQPQGSSGGASGSFLSFLRSSWIFSRSWSSSPTSPDISGCRCGAVMSQSALSEL